MAHRSDLALQVLHGNKLKGFSESEAIARAVGRNTDDVRGALMSLKEEGLVLYREGRLSGWMLTPEGREAHRVRLAADVQAMGNLADLQAAYEAFLELNGLLLRACTAWQVKDLESNTLNDHADPAYDARVIAGLGEIHRRVVPICDQLHGLAERFDNYGTRLDLAFEKVTAGEREWFAKPLIDSYHTVWMELHEDLLASLRIDRSSEPSH